MFKHDGVLFDYFTSVKMNTVARETVTIQLLAALFVEFKHLYHFLSKIAAKR